MSEPIDNLVCLVIESYKKTYKKFIDENLAKDIAKVILSHRDLVAEFEQNPENIIKDICSMNFQSDKVYFPCDVIELRRILSNKMIFSLGSVAFFPYLFCKKYFIDHSIILSLSKPDDGIQSESSVILSCDNPFYVNDILGIYVREDCLSPEQIQQVNEIVKQCSPTTSVYRIGDIPATREPKIAQQNMLQYIVNIETIGIKNQTIQAHSPESAVNQALTQRWHTLSKKTGQKTRPAKFHLEYWLNTPFWAEIVKPKHQHKQVEFNWHKTIRKMSDASSGAGPDTTYFEGERPGDAKQEFTYGPGNPVYPFTVGDKVRLRAKGLGFQQTEGRVTKREDSRIQIRWDTGERKGKNIWLDMNEPVQLFALIEKI